MPDAWEIKSAGDVAEALDWLRRRMKGSGLLLVAIGPNSVAYALDPQMKASDAVEALQAQIQGGTLERGLEDLERERVTRGFRRREL